MDEHGITVYVGINIPSFSTLPRRLKCSVCPVTCPSITTLREHIRIHTGERPYSCDQCELKFKRSQALKQHLISIHNGPGSASYACSVCGVAFKRRGNLMRHILSCHQGVRRFICGLCGHRYAQNQDLRRHLITKHQIQLANNPIIEKKPAQVYVYPPLEALPASDAQYINIIIAEEGLKIQKLLAIENDTNSSTDIEHTIPLRSAAQMLSMKPVSGPEKVTIQSKEYSESITNKDSVTFMQEHSYIPLLSFHICTQCNNVTIRKRQSITDHENNSSSCEQCYNVREEFPDLRAEPTVVKPGLVIAGQRSVSLENLSSSNSEAALNDRLINEVLTTEFEEYLYESIASLMNPDLDGASDQMPIQNVMIQPSSAMSSKFSNENFLMATSIPPSITDNSMLTNKSFTPAADLPLNNLSNLKMDGALLSFTSPQISAETDHCKSKSSEEEKKNNISADTVNKEAYHEAQDLPLNNQRNFKMGGALPHISSLKISAQTHNYKLNKSLEEEKNYMSADTANKKAYREEAYSPLYNLSSPKMGGAMPPFTSQEISDEIDNCKSNKSSEVERNDSIPEDTANNKICLEVADLSLNNMNLPPFSPKISAGINNCKSNKSSEIHKANRRVYPEIGSSDDPFPQISHTSLTLNDVIKSDSYDCKICKKKCDRKSALERHMKVHSGDTPFKCKTCERPFKLKHNLIVHSRTHTGERRYECLLCSKSFRYHKDLLNHEKRHQGLRPYLCEECGKQFLRHADLKRHGDIHNNKRYQCPVCHKLFRRLDHMKMVHMKIHEKAFAKAFKCEQCKKKFSSRLTLRKHRLLHSGMKRYNCIICNKSFVFKMYLESHMKTHERQENYVQCPRCPRKFVSEGTCQIHMSKFHRVNINDEEEQQIKNTIIDTVVEDSPSTMINREFDCINTEGMNYGSLEDQSCSTVIYVQMFVENEVPLLNEVQ